MKSILTAVLVMMAIIAVQMGLSYAFSFHVAESRLTDSAVFGSPEAVFLRAWTENRHYS